MATTSPYLARESLLRLTYGQFVEMRSHFQERSGPFVTGCCQEDVSVGDDSHNGRRLLSASHVPGGVGARHCLLAFLCNMGVTDHEDDQTTSMSPPLGMDVGEDIPDAHVVISAAQLLDDPRP